MKPSAITQPINRAIRAWTVGWESGSLGCNVLLQFGSPPILSSALKISLGTGITTWSSERENLETSIFFGGGLSWARRAQMGSAVTAASGSSKATASQGRLVMERSIAGWALDTIR